MNTYQIGISTGDKREIYAKPVTEYKKAADLAELVGIQVVEEVDAENGQWLAHLLPTQANALEKMGSMEIEVEFGEAGPFVINAEMP